MNWLFPDFFDCLIVENMCEKHKIPMNNVTTNLYRNNGNKESMRNGIRYSYPKNRIITTTHRRYVHGSDPIVMEKVEEKIV